MGAGELVAENIRAMMEKKRAFQTLRIAACHYSTCLDSEHDRLELARNLCAENPHVAHVAK